MSTLTRYAHTLELEVFAERFGRTVGAVRHKRARLGLGKTWYHDWTEDQLSLVRAHPRGAKRQPLADQLGLDVGRVGSMIANLRRKERHAA